MSAVHVGGVLGDHVDPAAGGRLDALAARAGSAAAAIDSAVHLAREVGRETPVFGEAPTIERWDLLATLGAADLTVARVLEPHLDALDIRHQAGLAEDHEHTWGVYAAEARGVGVTATRVEGHDDDADGVWRLDGVKPWCSLAGRLDRALITAHTGDGTRRLFACSLAHPGVTVGTSAWVARGLVGVTSDEVGFDGVEATPVGADGWYLDRPGFAWGGIGVAAIWFGASVAVARTLRTHLQAHGREPDQIGRMHLGETDALLHAAAAVLAVAARRIDASADGGARPAHPSMLAHRVRSTVSASAERIMTIAAHALGPAPLAFDEEHARRIADLQLYVRQDHAERDLAALGASVIATGGASW